MAPIRTRRAPPARRLVRRVFDRLLLVVFLVVIFLPVADRAFKLDRSRQFHENRAPAARPELRPTLNALIRFPALYDLYYADHFGFRNLLIRWHFKLRRFFVSAVVPLVQEGRDGWLFFANRESIEDYKVTRLIPPESLERWRLAVVQMEKVCRGAGAHLLIVFSPTKPNVYPEHLPPSFYRLRKETRIEQLIAHLRATTSADVLYLKDAVVRAKTERQLYYRYDTHWNQYGAFVAFREIIRYLKPRFPRLEVPSVDGYTFEKTVSLPSDLLGLQGIDARGNPLYAETDWRITPHGGRKYRVVRAKKLPQPMNFGEFFAHSELDTTHPDPGLPSLVMFHDSYGAQFIRYFAERFSPAMFRAQYTFDAGLVERERPDLVIVEIIDRHVHWAFPL